MFEYTRQVQRHFHPLMPAPEQVLYAMPAMRALLRAEAATLREKVPSRAGSFGLRLGMQDAVGGCPDAVAHWIGLQRRGLRWTGPVHADVREPLPFAGEGFAVVWLSQVLQFHPDPRGLLTEAARLTSPGGILALSGMHPVSAWSPWLSWCMRGTDQPMRLRAPLQWTQALERAGLEVEAVNRFGQVLPHAARPGGIASLLGGGYLLVARKRQDAVTPLHNVRRLRRARLQGTLATGAHRECA
jgi:SAM-dependent methyltransferase